MGVRQQAIRRMLEQADPETLDLKVDARLLNLHSEDKQGAAATFKGTFGFAPMMCFIEPFGLPAGMLRPGRSTANNAGDRLAALDPAIGCLPAALRTLVDDNELAVAEPRRPGSHAVGLRR